MEYNDERDLEKITQENVLKKGESGKRNEENELIGNLEENNVKNEVKLSKERIQFYNQIDKEKERERELVQERKNLNNYINFQTKENMLNFNFEKKNNNIEKGMEQSYNINNNPNNKINYNSDNYNINSSSYNNFEYIDNNISNNNINNMDLNSLNKNRISYNDNIRDNIRNINTINTNRFNNNLYHGGGETSYLSNSYFNNISNNNTNNMGSNYNNINRNLGNLFSYKIQNKETLNRYNNPQFNENIYNNNYINSSFSPNNFIKYQNNNDDINPCKFSNNNYPINYNFYNNQKNNIPINNNKDFFGHNIQNLTEPRINNLMDFYFYKLYKLMHDSKNIPSNQFNYDNLTQIGNYNNLDKNMILRGINNEIKINKNQLINDNYFNNVDNRLFNNDDNYSNNSRPFSNVGNDNNNDNYLNLNNNNYNKEQFNNNLNNIQYSLNLKIPRSGININNNNNNEEDNKNIIINVHKMFTSMINLSYNTKLKDISYESQFDITLFSLKNEDINQKVDFIYKLMKYNIGTYDKIDFPSISIENIKERARILKYVLTNEDNEILDNTKNCKSDLKFLENRLMHYSNNKMSIYYPHVIKTKNDITSIFLTENQKKLSIYDFQYIYSHQNKEHIFKKLLEKRISEFNQKKFDKKIYGFFENYMYTIMDKSIVENKLSDLDYKNLKEQLLPNLSEIGITPSRFEDYQNISNSQNANIENSSIKDFPFINSDNIQYLKGISYEQIMLYIILKRLESYDPLPNIIFYETFININGERIIIYNNDLPPGYMEIDYVLFNHSDFYFDQKESPLYVQLECDKNGFVKSNDDRIFKMEKNKLYFCEFKNSLKSLEYEKKLIDKGKKGIKDPKEFLKSLINKCKKFRNLYINEFSIDKDAEVNIIIFYDDTISDIFESYTDEIRTFIGLDKIKLIIVYVLPSYIFCSLNMPIENEKIMKKKYDEMEKKYGEMEEIKKKYGEMEEIKKKYGEMEEMKNKYIEMDKKYGEMEKKYAEMDKKLVELNEKMKKNKEQDEIK